MKKILQLIIFFSFFQLTYSQISSFPHSVSFEQESDLGTSLSDRDSKWTTATSGDWSDSVLLWTRASGSTPSPSTGPSQAQDELYYIYVETSGSSSSDEAELSCNFDFSGKTNAAISFYYHNYGFGNGNGHGSAQMELYVYDTDSAAWSSALWTSDSGINGGSDNWYYQSVDLSAYNNKSIQIWFKLNSRGWASDGALDNITVSADEPSNALRFSGTPDYAKLSSGVYFNGDFTIECWVYPTVFSNWSRIIDFGNGPNNNNVLLAYTYGTTGKPALHVGGAEFSASTAIPLNQWTHVAATLNGTTAKIYINGTVSATANFNNPPANVTRTKNYIGRSNWGTGDPDANAIYDDLRIWSVARSASEIQSNMNYELSGNETGLHVYFPFNQGVACGDNTSITEIQDMAASGGVSNAILYNFELNNGCESNFTAGVMQNETFINSSGNDQWDTASNWSSGSVPSSSYNVTISSGQTIEVGNSTVAVANNLTIDSGGSLTIAKNSDLTLSGNFTNNGTVTLNSDADEFASIIVQGSSSGDIVYNRYVNTVGSAEWDLIGAPTDGLSISSFVTTNSTPLATSGSNYAVGVYDNSDNSWTNYTSSTVGAENFDIGRGYQMATSSGATMAFTGTVATTDQTQSIINNAGNGGRRWNLVANPYPSYLNANTNAHASNNFLSVNSGVIDSNFSAIYGYDADGSGYTIYNNTSAATYIAPGQAFFVAAASSSATNLSFTEAMQTTNGGDDFIAGRLANTSSELYLKLYEEQNLVGDTKFYFDNNLSLGLDPGYDAGAYNQSSALASRLAEDDQGVNMGINAMGIDSFEQTTIPIVVNTEAGTSFRISLEDLTIPESVEVFLEDTETQNFTNLRTEDFTLNPQSELSGMGRFYLRLGNTSLGGSDVEESYISIYNPMDKDCITIEGLASIQKANVRLYNIIGQEILSKTLQTGLSTQNISTAGLTTGVYIIKLEVDSTLISKKIVIN